MSLAAQHINWARSSLADDLDRLFDSEKLEQQHNRTKTYSQIYYNDRREITIRATGVSSSLHEVSSTRKKRRYRKCYSLAGKHRSNCVQPLSETKKNHYMLITVYSYALQLPLSFHVWSKKRKKKKREQHCEKYRTPLDGGRGSGLGSHHRPTAQSVNH